MKSSAAKIPPPYSLRPAAPPDEGFLFRLYASTRAEELARSGWNAVQRDDFLRAQFRARQADYARRFPGAEHSIIQIEAAEAGAWTVWRGPREIRLVNLELLPEHRGRGLGSALLRKLVEEAATLRLPLKLSVREDNLAAIRLYRRLGFRPESRAHGYLGMRHRV